MRWPLSPLLLLFAGCSTHPLPDPVTRQTTVEIVQRLRCEARDGLVASLDKFSTPLNQTYIGFDFTFDIVENNNANGGVLEITDSLARGTFKLAFGAGIEKKRENKRFFRVIELLSELMDDPILQDRKKGPCATTYGANLVYPISGRVGLDEVVTSYATLQQSSTLGLDDKDIVFSDSIGFVTKLSASITPALELAAVTGKLKLTKASASGVADRSDTHKVVVAISKAKATSKTVKTAFGKEKIEPLANVLTSGRGSTVITRPSSAPVILELERQRNRDDDLSIFNELRLLSR